MPILDTWRGGNKPEGVRAFMGWNGLTITDESVDVLDMLRAFMQKASAESCGQCFPCRSCLKRIVNILNRFCRGEERADDVERLTEIAHLVRDSARCDMGRTAMRPLLDILEQKPELLYPHATIPGAYAATVTAPCISACPSQVNVPDYLEKIRFRQFDQALETVMRDCAMPGTIGRVCVRPCEAACKRGEVDAPLAIKQLKRFLADEDARQHPYLQPRHVPVGTRKVAVAGAGPAGLSCAYYLGKAGFAVTIFEALESAGGMAKFGIPDYRLPPDVLQREIDKVLAQGCVIQYGVTIGQELTLLDLELQGYEAVFIGIGAPEGTQMFSAEESASCRGLITGVAYLAGVTRGKQLLQGKRVAVIGGGNVAMDCVRSARRQGFEDVQLLYRRTRQEMPADAQEILEAQEEGVVFNYLVAPLRILIEEGGNVIGLRCQKMRLGEPDASGRRRPVPEEGGEFTLPCDAVISAVGQTVTVSMMLKGLDGGLNKWNCLEVDALTGRVSGQERLFGGGDCATGPDTLIVALAAGKRAAAHITSLLRGQGVEPSQEERLKKLLHQHGARDAVKDEAPVLQKERIPLRLAAPEERIKDFLEVEASSTDVEAVREAERCLRCFRVALAAF